MLRIDRERQGFARLDPSSLTLAKLRERYDLQQMIVRDAAAFFAELGEELLLLGQEVRPSDVVDERIDLLALDPDGAVVVIELKRDTHKLQLLQSLSYAAMIADWTPDELFALRPAGDDARPDADEFLVDATAGVNARQRIILIAEGFDYAVLRTAEWLRERNGIDIRCFKLVVMADGASEFLGCVRVFPPSDIDEVAVRRGPRASDAPAKPSKWKDWDEAIAAIAEPCVARFFREEIAAGRPSYLRKRQLRFHVGGRRRWWAAARADRAYVWQNGRFAGDVAFWQARLTDPRDVGEVKEGTRLRLFLRTASDFAAFRAAAQTAATLQFEDAGSAADDADPEV